MTEPNRQSGENEERIIEIEIERLRPFKEHPFQVKDDKEMFLLQESIEKYGILNPLIVRPVPDGYYEIISGHRRKHAAEKLGYRKVPVIIRVLSEDDSILSMVDSNLHRERISYSEKAFAYKLKNDVLKRKSGRKKSQVDHKTPRKRAIEIISEDCGDSPKQVQRYISLTKLIPEMLQKLDDEIISFCPAVEIAALSEKEQKELLVAMEYYLKVVTAVVAGDTEGLQESQMRYAGIPDTKCVYPPEAELAEWIEQRDTVQMVEALKKVVPDKKEHPVRISVITLILAYSTFFYGF